MCWWLLVFRDRVVAHYVHRGYTVEADKIIEGESGSPHRCDLACHSDLGDLVVFFGDEDPFEGPELGSIRRAAIDLGAAAVVAVPQASAALKAAARQHRVILLDEDALEGPKEEEPLLETIDVGRMSDASAAPVHVPVPEPVPLTDEQASVAAPAVSPDRIGAFDWLPEDAAAPRRSVGTIGKREIPLHWLWGPLLYLAATLVIVIVGAVLFL